MPIKFRCQHCRQFLGISRSKAGDVVDCPSCGRTLRVPALDGTVAPVPEPKINVNELAGALDELARIGEERGDEEGPAPVHKPVVVKELAPLPTPEPISIEAPPPAVAVDVHAQKPRRAAAPTSAAVVAPVTTSPDAASFPAVLKSAPVLGTMATLAFLAFLLGWIVGGMGGADPADPDPNGSDGKKAAVTPPKPPPPLRPVFEPQHWKPAVRGLITYKTTEGSFKPDQGARILLLPEKRPGGQAKLPVTGFWSAANEADYRLALAGLRELGGNAALADAEGRFELNLPPSAGSYHIVAISSHSEDEFDTPVPASARTLLVQYFDRPDALIRRLHYKHSTVKFSGASVETWTHKFE